MKKLAFLVAIGSLALASGTIGQMRVGVSGSERAFLNIFEPAKMAMAQLMARRERSLGLTDSATGWDENGSA